MPARHLVPDWAVGEHVQRMGGVEPGGESFDELFGLIRRSEANVPLVHVDTPAVLISVYLDIDVHRNLQSAREQGLAYRFVVRWRPADGPEDQGGIARLLWLWG